MESDRRLDPSYHGRFYGLPAEWSGVFQAGWKLNIDVRRSRDCDITTNMELYFRNETTRKLVHLAHSGGEKIPSFCERSVNPGLDASLEINSLPYSGEYTIHVTDPPGSTSGWFPFQLAIEVRSSPCAIHNCVRINGCFPKPHLYHRLS